MTEKSKAVCAGRHLIDLPARAGVRVSPERRAGFAVETIEEIYNFTTGYAFDWKIRGSTDEVQRPCLALDMQTGLGDRPGGKPVETRLHDDALRQADCPSSTPSG